MSGASSEEPAASPAGTSRPWWRRRPTLVVALGVLVVAAVLVIADAALADRMARGTTVSGVPVGGLSRAQAVVRIEREIGDRTDRPLDVEVDGQDAQLTPGEAGLAVDAEASVAGAGAGGLWRQVSGGRDVEAVVDIDETALASALETLVDDETDAPVDGAVRLTRVGVKVREPVAGTAIDATAARAALIAAYLAADPRAVPLPTTQAPPDIDKADVASAVAEFAEPALSAPVTFRFGASEVVLEPSSFARALRLVPEDGRLVPQLRTRTLHHLLEGLVAEDGAAPVDATVRLVDGRPEVVPAKPGVTYDRGQVDGAFLDLVVQPEGERVLEVDAEVSEPAFSTADAEALGITEQVSTFTTYFPYAEYRNTNIGRAAQLVDGTVLRPGETFSLNGTVGERTAEKGFTEGFIISNGIFKEDLGGGVSQMATTTFNAAFFAGMTDVEHKPHSFYIDRYPVGREATVAWPTVDLQFRNDTPYGVLVSAAVTPSTPTSQGVATVTLYSARYWDITTETGDRYDFTSPATRTLDTEDCYPNAGYDGFDIDIRRFWRRVGSDDVVRTETMHTTYTPSDTVICKPPGSLKP